MYGNSSIRKRRLSSVCLSQSGTPYCSEGQNHKETTTQSITNKLSANKSNDFVELYESAVDSAGCINGIPGHTVRGG